MKNAIISLKNIPPDKKKHIRYDLGVFAGVLIILAFTSTTWPWMVRCAWLTALAAAGMWEIAQKITKKGTPELADFLYSIAIPTILLIINELVTWAL